MAVPRPFYSKFCWKDWFIKTEDLTPNEYYAYHRMLTWAACNSPDLCSLPADDTRLQRISGLGPKAWRSAKPRVMTFFFLHLHPADGRPRAINPRLLEDAAAWFQMVEKQRKAACHRHSQTNANQNQNQNKEKKHPLTPSPRSARRVGEIEGFAEWYQAYPRHVARKAAERAYLKALKETTPTSLLVGAQRYADEVRGRDPEKIKHPATWLNGGCWQDEARPLATLALIEADPLAHIRAEIERREREEAQ